MSLDLSKTTILIGENNTGKTTILDAVQIALGSIVNKSRRNVGAYDHHLTADIDRADRSEPIEIILRFAEQENEEWPDSIIQRMENAIQTDMEGNISITVRMQGKYNVEEDRSDLEWSFRTLKDAPQSINSTSTKNLLQKVVKSFSLYSIRDPNQEFKPNTKFWGAFIRSVKMELAQSDEFEQKLTDLNQEIISMQESLSEVREQINQITKLVHFDQDKPVNIEALPSRVSEILSRAQVILASPTGAKIPVKYHGEGTQSLAVMYLLMAYLQTKIREQASYILTIEEPEAHLHPSASASVVNMLSNMHNGQSIVATHSGDVVSKADVLSLRRLHSVNGKVECYKISADLESKEKRMVEHFIKATRGNLLFARCWLLVEGESDYTVLNACASACNIDLIQEGVYCIEYAQTPGTAVTWIKIARQLGIEWVFVADGDNKGEKNTNIVKQDLKNRDIPEEYINRRIFKLDYILEVVLCLNGYGRFYNNGSSNEDNSVEDWKKAIDIVKKLKNTIAIDVANQIELDGADHVPGQLRDIIFKSVELVRKTHGY